MRPWQNRCSAATLKNLILKSLHHSVHVHASPGSACAAVLTKLGGWELLGESWALCLASLPLVMLLQGSSGSCWCAGAVASRDRVLAVSSGSGSTAGVCAGEAVCAGEVHPSRLVRCSCCRAGSNQGALGAKGGLPASASPGQRCSSPPAWSCLMLCCAICR